MGKGAKAWTTLVYFGGALGEHDETTSWVKRHAQADEIASYKASAIGESVEDGVVCGL